MDEEPGRIARHGRHLPLVAALLLALCVGAATAVLHRDLRPGPQRSVSRVLVIDSGASDVHERLRTNLIDTYLRATYRLIVTADSTRDRAIAAAGLGPVRPSDVVTASAPWEVNTMTVTVTSDSAERSRRLAAAVVAQVRPAILAAAPGLAANSSVYVLDPARSEPDESAARTGLKGGALGLLVVVLAWRSLQLLRQTAQRAAVLA
jgi:hypothetical protein